MKRTQADINMIIMADEGRWDETVVATENGSHHIFHGNLYGVTGATTDGDKFKEI